MMDNFLVEKIRDHAISAAPELSFHPAMEDAIKSAEQRIGFSMPSLLKSCYLKAGNGGFGPGYGIIGLEGGFASDYGNVVETYELLKRDQESEGKKMQHGMLPFCEWGCNIYSCVDCDHPTHSIYTFEDFVFRPQNYTLDQFFELWISGVEILSYDGSQTENVEVSNPFTGRKDRVSKRKHN